MIILVESFIAILYNWSIKIKVLNYQFAQSTKNEEEFLMITNMGNLVLKGHNLEIIKLIKLKY